MDGPQASEPNKGPLINYVAKRDRLSIRQNTIFTRKTDRLFLFFSKYDIVKIGTSRERLKNFQSSFEEVSNDFSVAMKNLLKRNNFSTIGLKVKEELFSKIRHSFYKPNTKIRCPRFRKPNRHARLHLMKMIHFIYT